MPKANHGGATAAGMTGIVEHGAPLADGRVLSELDPERNLDGTLIEGDHPDHADGEERETTPLSDPRPLPDRGVDEDDTQNLEPVYKTDEQKTPDDGNSVATADADRSSAKEQATPASVKRTTPAKK